MRGCPAPPRKKPRGGPVDLGFSGLRVCRLINSRGTEVYKRLSTTESSLLLCLFCHVKLGPCTCLSSLKVSELSRRYGCSCGGFPVQFSDVLRESLWLLGCPIIRGDVRSSYMFMDLPSDQNNSLYLGDTSQYFGYFGGPGAQTQTTSPHELRTICQAKRSWIPHNNKSSRAHNIVLNLVPTTMALAFESVPGLRVQSSVPLSYTVSNRLTPKTIGDWGYRHTLSYWYKLKFESVVVSGSLPPQSTNKEAGYRMNAASPRPTRDVPRSPTGGC